MSGSSVNWDTLRDLAGFRADSGCAISFYVNLDPRLTPTTSDVQTRTRSMLDETQKRAESSRGQRTHEQHASVRHDLQRIREYFERDFDRNGANGLAIFAAALDNYWRPIPLAAPVPDVAKVNNDFYVSPLVPIVGLGDGVLVAYVGRERGDAYELRDGRLEGVAARFDEAPRRHDQGGWSQANIQRRVDGLARGHIRETAEEIDRLVRSRRSTSVVMVCAEEIRPELAEMLSHEAMAAVVGWTNAEAHASPAELLELVEPVLERARAEREAESVGRWREDIGRQSRAAAGWEATLEAANEGRIELLLFSRGADHAVWRCPACSRLQVRNGRCPLDGTELERREEGLDLVLHRTLARAGTARELQNRRDLDPVGGIGAVLRY